MMTTPTRCNVYWTYLRAYDRALLAVKQADRASKVRQLEEAAEEARLMLGTHLCQCETCGAWWDSFQEVQRC